MKNFIFTKQLVTAALVATVGFFGCQKNEMDEVNDTLMASNTQNLVQNGLQLDFSESPVIAGNEVIISATRLESNAQGTLRIFEYNVGGAPAQSTVAGGTWVQKFVTTSTPVNGPYSYSWTPTVANVGWVSYKVEYIHPQGQGTATKIALNDLQIINPCTEGEMSFNAKTFTVGDDVLGIRDISVTYSLDFCLEDARRIVVTALLLQPEEVEVEDEVGLVTNNGKNRLITWSQDATSGTYNFGVSFSKKFKGNGNHKLTGVWNAKIYNAAGEMIAEMNSPAHASFE
jgi:hypothetical protein